LCIFTPDAARKYLDLGQEKGVAAAAPGGVAGFFFGM
jgi:hypothetical protein